MKNKLPSHQELFAELKELVQKERKLIVSFLRVLHEVDKRKLYLEMGYSSLFALCTDGLGYSNGSAFRRTKAVECMYDNPEILEKLESGALTLCAISELARVSADKRAEVLPLSEGKTKVEVAKIVAPYLPVTSTVKKRREKVSVSRVEVPTAPLFTSTVEQKEQKENSEVKYSVTFEITKEEFELLEELQIVSGSSKKLEGVLKAARLYNRLKSSKERQRRREVRKQKVLSTPTSTAEAQSTSTVKVTTRHIPVPIRDRVILRDGAQCSFHSEEGHRCQETKYLQIDHIKPFSIGGEHTEENLRVLCPGHNRFVYQRNLSDSDPVRKQTYP